MEIAETCYVGISGAAYLRVDEGNPGNSVYHPSTDPSPQVSHGPMSASGMLGLKHNVRIGECTDGTSNTMMVGEESDFSYVPVETWVKIGRSS